MSVVVAGTVTVTMGVTAVDVTYRCVFKVHLIVMPLFSSCIYHNNVQLWILINCF